MSGTTTDGVTLTLDLVSRDWSNANQSWTRTSVYTYASGISTPQRRSGFVRGSVRVEIRANAYERQSHARVSLWSDSEGWLFHTSIPTEQWYARAPSYTQKQDRWQQDHFAVYDDLEQQLLERFAATLFPGQEVINDG